MSLQNLTIRSPKPEDKSDFDRIHAGKHDLTASQAFTLVMNAYRSQGQNVSEKNTDGLQAELEKMKEENASLQVKINEVNAENEELKIKLTEAQNKPSEIVEKIVEVEAKLKDPAFIFNPADHGDLFKKMFRAISYDIKEGDLKKKDKDLPAQFTVRALKYYIKNEYNHILK